MTCPNCKKALVEIKGNKHRCEDCGWFLLDIDKQEWQPTTPPQVESPDKVETQTKTQEGFEKSEQPTSKAPDSLADRVPEPHILDKDEPEKKPRRKLDLFFVEVEYD